MFAKRQSPNQHGRRVVSNNHFGIGKTNSTLSAIVMDTDQTVSKLTDISQHTNLCQSRLNNIQNHLTQDGLGGGTSHGVMLDSCSSKLGDISSNSGLTASRLSNIQDWQCEGGDGTGDKLGVMVKSMDTRLSTLQDYTDGVETTLSAMLVDTDAIDSSLNTVEANSTLQASRLSNIQDWVGTSDGVGGGTKTGVNISSLAGCVAGNELQVDIVSGAVTVSGGATAANQSTIITSLGGIETILTAIDTVNDNILVKNTEIDTAIDLTNSKIDTFDAVLDNILTKNTAIETTCNGIETLITTQNTYDILHNVSSQNLATHTALKNNEAFTADTYTTTIDLLVSGTTEIYRDLTVYGKYDDATSPQFHFAYSDDDTNYFIDPAYHAESITDGTSKHFRMSYENIPFRYVRIYNDTTASTTATYLYWVALKHR